VEAAPYTSKPLKTLSIDPRMHGLLEQVTSIITVEIEGIQRNLILDTGLDISIFHPGVSRSEMRCTSVKPYGVTGETLEIRGQQSVSFVFNEHEFKHLFYLCTLPTKSAGLIGMELMEKTKDKIDFEKARCRLIVISREPKLVIASPTRQATFTVFPRGKEGHSPHPSQLVAREKDKNVRRSSNNESTTSQTSYWLIKFIENTVIEPRCRQVVIEKLNTEKGKSLPSLICMEPEIVPIHGVHPERVVTRVQTRSSLLPTSLRGHIISEAPRN
jgi:hypothetical protein